MPPIVPVRQIFGVPFSWPSPTAASQRPSTTRPALAICEQFAAAAGFRWAGGLALGEGGAINGQPLAKAGGMVHNVVAALDLAAAALAEGEPVPAEAIALMARPFIPASAYMLMGDLGWLMQARRNRALTRLAARPFAIR